jgi:transposase
LVVGASDEKPSWYLPPDSKVRVVALNILALRAAGKSDDEIAKELQISPKSISPYVYRAAKNGWLTADTPTDRVKYELLNRVIDRLGEGLEDGTRHVTSGMRVRTAVAMKMAEGTIFKEFDQQGSGVMPSTVVAVQVIMPEGARQTMREDTIGGTPNYVDGDVVKP